MVLCFVHLIKIWKYLSTSLSTQMVVPFPLSVQFYEIELNFTAQGGIYKAICIKNISNPKMIGHLRMGEFKSTRSLSIPLYTSTRKKNERSERAGYFTVTIQKADRNTWELTCRQGRVIREEHLPLFPEKVKCMSWPPCSPIGSH